MFTLHGISRARPSSAGPGPARLLSARLAQLRPARARPGSAWLHSARLGLVGLGSLRHGSARPGCARLGSVCWAGVQFGVIFRRWGVCLQGWGRGRQNVNYPLPPRGPPIYIYTTDPLPDPPFTNVLEQYIYIYDRPFSGSPFWTAPQNRLFEFIGSKTLYIYIYIYAGPPGGSYFGA